MDWKLVAKTSAVTLAVVIGLFSAAVLWVALTHVLKHAYVPPAFGGVACPVKPAVLS